MTYRSNGGHSQKPKIPWIPLLIAVAIMATGIVLTANEATQEIAAPFLMVSYCLYVLIGIGIGLYRIRRR